MLHKHNLKNMVSCHLILELEVNNHSPHRLLVSRFNKSVGIKTNTLYFARTKRLDRMIVKWAVCILQT